MSGFSLRIHGICSPSPNWPQVLEDKLIQNYWSYTVEPPNRGMHGAPVQTTEKAVCPMKRFHMNLNLFKFFTITESKFGPLSLPFPVSGSFTVYAYVRFLQKHREKRTKTKTRATSVLCINEKQFRAVAETATKAALLLFEKIQSGLMHCKSATTASFIIIR